MNGMIIDRTDNVGVAIYGIKKGELISYRLPNGVTSSVVAEQDIPIYHKFSVRNITVNEPIVKYGQHIGKAGEDIAAGCHVHVHNVVSVRENLE